MKSFVCLIASLGRTRSVSSPSGPIRKARYDSHERAPRNQLAPLSPFVSQPRVECTEDENEDVYHKTLVIFRISSTYAHGNKDKRYMASIRHAVAHFAAANLEFIRVVNFKEIYTDLALELAGEIVQSHRICVF